MAPVAHGLVPIDDLWRELSQFGADWLMLLPILAVGGGLLVFAGTRASRGDLRDTGGLLDDTAALVARGAGRLLDLPAWAAGPLALLWVFGLPFAALGFYWDVAWHIDLGRDEFLLSPPHVALLLGLTSIGLAGLWSVREATATGADTRWRTGGFHVPVGAAALLVAGLMAVTGWGIDELWHANYGLDVTMWSPPHLMMIWAATLTPIAGLLLLAETGPASHRGLARKRVLPFLLGASVIALSASTLEFDIGVPQWQSLFHPVITLLAAAFGLHLGRVALGRGGALAVAVHVLVVRAVLWAVTGEVLGLTAPWFPTLLGATVAVEAAHAAAARRGWSPTATALTAGGGAVLLGFAVDAPFSQLWLDHPWGTSMLPGILIAVPGGAGAAVLADAMGRVVRLEPIRTSVRALTAAGVATVVALAWPLPREVPEATATIVTEHADAGSVHVEVTLDRPELAADPDRFHVMAWQGGGLVNADLVPVDGDTWRAERAVPVTGEWKAMVLLAARDAMAGAPVRLPADPEIDARAIPVVEERTAPLTSQVALLQREAHAGPAWPASVAYGSLFLGTMGVLALLVLGAASLDRRHREEAGPEAFPDRREQALTRV